jgi:glutamate-1-semialdehyde 2,1-aminomutase
MSAVRVARGFTGRPKVVKFAGAYHGHSDGLLARAGSGVATQALPDSEGVPASVVAETIVVPYNDLDATRRAFEERGESIAAVVVEPVAGNMSVVPPAPGFLAGLERLCRAHGALLIADEVITGFRLRRGTVHRSLGARADLVTLGKVIGGGLPIGAYGGRRDAMETVAPLGPVYQAGTLSGSPLAMAAGAATLDALRPWVYRRLESVAQRLERTLREAAQTSNEAAFWPARVGSMVGMFFGMAPAVDSTTALAVDRARYGRFFGVALEGGVHLPPSPLETAFVSAPITPADIERLVPVFERAFAAARVAA